MGVTQLHEDAIGVHSLVPSTSKDAAGPSLVSSTTPATRSFAVPKPVSAPRSALVPKPVAPSPAGPMLALACADEIAKGGMGQKGDRSQGQRPDASDKGKVVVEARLTKKQKCNVYESRFYTT